MIAQYREAEQRLDLKIKQLWDLFKKSDKPPELKRQIQILSEIRLDIKNTRQYLQNYYEMRFAYGSEKRVTDCERYFHKTSRVSSTGDISRFTATDRGAEEESCFGDAE